MEHGDVDVIEVGLKTAVDSPSTDRYYNLCGKTTLPEAAAIIEGARLFIGLDSGPAHLANAVRTPGVILLGRYLAFERYQPFSGHYSAPVNATMVFAGGKMDLISVDQVKSAVQARLSRLAR